MVSNVKLNKSTELVRLRIALIIGACLVVAFMGADILLLPNDMYELYLFDRLFVQVPIIALAITFSFWRHFSHYKAYVFAILLVALSFSNYWLIWVCWTEFGFVFPYEGTILYAFYCVFALGIPFKLALIANALSIVGFIWLMWLAPVYGDRVTISSAFVAGSLFICAYAKYRLDRTLSMLKESNERLLKLSKFDPLTDLLNRRALRERCAKLLAISKRHNVSMAVLMLDLDDFKKYNDSFGHQQGDEAIKVQASIMKATFKRETDIIGRYGGEEFIVVLSDITPQQVNENCQALFDKWRDMNMRHAEGAKHPIMSCSIGAVYAENVAETSIDALIDDADEALYQAKTKGKACFELVSLENK